MHWNRVTWTIVWTMSLILTVVLSTPVSAWEIDATDTVNRVIDGGTFVGTSLGRVRLSDIDTPEVGEPGADEATDYLTALILYEEVHLDIDDVDQTDRYGRWIAVVYVRHNATHLLNVNEALLQAGLADVWDFPNEFDPYACTPILRMMEPAGEPQAYRPGDFSSLGDYKSYCWAKGQLGERVLGSLFFAPEPPRKVL